MPVGQLEVEVRSTGGKGPARRLRAQGKTPGICYGAQAQPIPIAFDSKALVQALDPVKKRNTLLTLQVKGNEGGASEVVVLLRDTQLDPLTQRIEHADFIRIRMDQPVRVTIPIELRGKPEGVKIGGLLNVVYRHLEILVKPDAIPTKISVDIEKLGIGDAIHVSDLQLGEGIKALLAPGTAIASVVAPKAEKEAEEAAPTAVAGAPAEGAAAAPGAPGAAPGAAPAAGAAAAPAKGAAPAAKGAAPAAKGAEKKEGKK